MNKNCVHTHTHTRAHTHTHTHTHTHIYFSSEKIKKPTSGYRLDAFFSFCLLIGCFGTFCTNRWRLFSIRFCAVDYSEIMEGSITIFLDPSDKCSLFLDSVLLKLNKYILVTQVEPNDIDNEWMTPRLKALFSQREKAFQCKDKLLWRRLRNKINRMRMYIKNGHYNTLVSHLKTTNPGTWYKQIKIITKRNLDSPVIKVRGIADNDPKFYMKKQQKLLTSCLYQ